MGCIACETREMLEPVAEVRRTLWAREDELVNQRLTWLLNSQLGMFAGYGALLLAEPKDASQRDRYEGIRDAGLPIVGLCLAIVLLLGILAAQLAQVEIALRRRRRRLGVATYTSVLGWAPGAALPLAAAVAWAPILGWPVGRALAAAGVVLIVHLAVLLGRWYLANPPFPHNLQLHVCTCAPKMIESVASLTTSEQLFALVREYNWNDGFGVPRAVADHEACDLGVALLLFWHGGALEFLTTWVEDRYHDEEWISFCELMQSRLLKRYYAAGTSSFSPDLTRVQLYQLRKRGVDELLLADVVAAPAPSSDREYTPA